jgi:hypothetical protein
MVRVTIEYSKLTLEIVILRNLFFYGLRYYSKVDHQRAK